MRHHASLPILATIVGIALFSAMDVVMKSASLAVGAYSAYLLRCLVGFVMIAPFWWYRARSFPSKSVMRIHLIRGVVVAFMGWTFFFALTRLPIAEAIAISFIAPVIALYLAAVLLKERIGRNAMIAALLGLAGVIVIAGGRASREAMGEEALIGLVAVLFSAVLYAWNLVLQRQQALVARPSEVSTFQNGIAALTLAAGAPFLLQSPDGAAWADISAGAALAVGAALCLSWGYARAEAQTLVPIEYTGFLWAAFFGWLVFDETVTATTLAGAILIVFGCWIGTFRQNRTPKPEQSAL